MLTFADAGRIVQEDDLFGPVIVRNSNRQIQPHFRRQQGGAGLTSVLHGCESIEQKAREMRTIEGWFEPARPDEG